jgi:hypothetical protein
MPSEHDVAFPRLSRAQIDALRRWGHVRPIAPGDVLFQEEIEAHAVISSLAIEAPSSVKRYFSSTGLPGKSPVTRAVTVTSGPRSKLPHDCPCEPPKRRFQSQRPRIRCRALRVESHADLSPQGLRQFQHDQLQSRDVGEVFSVRREQPEATLNRLRREPQVVDANMWISGGLSEFCSQAAENFGRFNSDPQLGFSAESTKHRGGSLLLRTGSQQLRAEADFGDVHEREIHRILASDGVDIGGSKCSAFNRDPICFCRSASLRIAQL